MGSPIDWFFGGNTVIADVQHLQAAQNGDLKGQLGVVGDYASVLSYQTPIIDVGLKILTLMTDMLGFGDPDHGDGFDCEQFHKALDRLGEAEPDPGLWGGTGADAYADRNKRQRDGVEEAADADISVSMTLSATANELVGVRDVVDGCSTMLALFIPVALALKWCPPAFLTVQATAVAGTVPVATGEMWKMAYSSLQNARKIREATQKYEEVANKARPAAAASDFDPPDFAPPRQRHGGGGSKPSSGTPHSGGDLPRKPGGSPHPTAPSQVPSGPPRPTSGPTTAPTEPSHPARTTPDGTRPSFSATPPVGSSPVAPVAASRPGGAVPASGPRPSTVAPVPVAPASGAVSGAATSAQRVSAPVGIPASSDPVARSAGPSGQPNVEER